MKNLFKYLRKTKIFIIIIFLLLVMQAYCDLSLPKYTSNMVNVGIQQSGITSSVPKVIRESKLNNLVIFADENEKEAINSSYKKIKKTKDNIKKYPLLKQEDILVLKNKDNEELLTDFFDRTFMIDSIFTNKKTSKAIKEKLNIPEEMDIYTVLNQMPKEALEPFLIGINKKLEKIEPSIMSQAGISLVKEEYKKIGLDTNKTQTDYIFKTGMLMLIIAFISMIITIIVAYLAAKVSAILGKDLRNSVFSKVLSLQEAEYKNYSTASLITRSTNDIQQIQMLAVMLLRVVFYAPIMAIGGIFMVLNTNTKMTWIIAVAVAAILFLVLMLFIIAMPKFKVLQKLIDKINLVSREILSGLSVIRAFAKEKHEEERFDKANTNLMKVNLFINRTMSLMMPLMMLTMNIIMVSIVWIGAGHIDKGNMQVGDMMAFMQYTMEIVMSFLMISMVSVVLPRALVSLNRINEVITTKNTIIDPENPESFIKDKKGYVEFRNVCFRYPDAPYDVITDINFIAKPGETTALIGSTGSGKSTVISLIPRFFDVTEGEILVDGINIKDTKMKLLREKIGFVPQKGLLFSGTIRSNITYGNKKATKKEIDTALKISQAKEFVEKLEKGIDTEIAQGGKNVSGGQRQRLSIARAIITNPEIFIFDDSFSALDFKTDSKLRHDLSKITKDKTVIIVAQRISTIMNADQIIVLDEGKIVGKGTHKDLMKSCDVYKQIALSQLSEEEVENAR